MNTLPKIPKDASIGEQQITPDVLRSTIPDILTPKGMQEFIGKNDDAKHVQQILDMLFKFVAKSVHAKSYSRVKKDDVIFKKIAQKRLLGEKYHLKDINDWVGNRIIVNNDRDIPEIIKTVKELLKGSFEIKKIEHIKKDGSYDAWHMDIVTTLPSGKTVNSELQIMTPQNEATAAITHDQHYVYGEKIPKFAQKSIAPQVDKAQDMPNEKAHQVAKKLVNLRKKNNDKPLPRQTINKTVNSLSQ